VTRFGNLYVREVQFSKDAVGASVIPDACQDCPRQLGVTSRAAPRTAAPHAAHDRPIGHWALLARSDGGLGHFTLATIAEVFELFERRALTHFPWKFMEMRAITPDFAKVGVASSSLVSHSKINNLRAFVAWLQRYPRPFPSLAASMLTFRQHSG
jgi:hypothetical protein